MLFAKTVDSVLATFKKTIDELHAVAERNDADMTDKRDRATKLINESVDHQNEAERARKVADKLQSIIG